MSTLLQIKSSLFAEDGKSSQLASRFVDTYRRHHPDTRLLVRDLAEHTIPHLDGERFLAFQTPAADRNEAQARIVAESDALIEELRAADIVVMGVPMYNFGVPSQLKAYFDHIARAGVSFRYTDQGPVGLLGDKKFYVFSTRGGRYRGTPADTQTGYVKTLLGFLGFHDVEFVYAEGLALGAEASREALDQAADDIRKLAA